MSPEEHLRRGAELLDLAEGRHRSGSFDLARVEAALATAHFAAATAEHTKPVKASIAYVFEGPREVTDG